MVDYSFAGAPFRMVRDSDRPRPIVIPAARFVQLPYDVVFSPDLKASAKLLYAAMAAHWWGTGACTASHGRLAALAGISRREVVRSIQKLVAAGHVLERDHGPGRPKSYQPTCDIMSHPSATMSQVQAATCDTGVTPQRHDVTPPCDIMSHKVERDISGVSIDTPDIDTSGGAVLQTAQPATEPTKAEKPKPAKPASKRRTGPPESFALTEELLTWAEGVGLNRTRAATETERWLDYHRGKGNVMADWTAAWRTWMRRAVEYGRERPNGSSAHGAPPSRGSAAPSRVISQEARDSWANWGKKTT